MAGFRQRNGKIEKDSDPALELLCTKEKLDEHDIMNILGPRVLEAKTGLVIFITST
jgi:hypothetical protein